MPLLVALACGCGPSDGGSHVTGLDEAGAVAPEPYERLSLPVNVPVVVGVVRVAAGNVWEEAYGGASTTGLTAQLWIMPGDRVKDAYPRVHPGQVVEVPGARIRIVAVTTEQVDVEVTTK